jgi:hypothetical protein
VIRADSLRQVWGYCRDALSAFGSWVQFAVSPAERVQRATLDAEYEAFMEQLSRLAAESDDETSLSTERQLPCGATEMTRLSEEITEREEVAINAASAVFHAAVVEALGTDDIYLHIQMGRYADAEP